MFAHKTIHINLPFTKSRKPKDVEIVGAKIELINSSHLKMVKLKLKLIAALGSFSMTTATAGLTPCKKMNLYSTFEFRNSVNLFRTPIGLKICSGQTCTDSDHFQKKIPKLAIVVRVLQNT